MKKLRSSPHKFGKQRLQACLLRPTTIWKAVDIRPVKAFIIGGITFSFLRAVLQWAAPWPIKLVFDSVLSNHSLPSILSWAPRNPTGRLGIFTLAIVLIAILLGLSSYGANLLLANAGQRIVFDLKCRLFRHIENQSLSFHLRNSIGDLLSRLGGDVQAMQGVVVNVLPVMTESVITIAGMMGIMLWIDWHFSLAVFALAPALYFTLRHYLAAIKITQKDARRNEGKASSLAQQVLLALPLVQTLGTEAEEGENYGNLARKSLEANKQAVLLQSRFTPIVTSLMTISGALVMYFGTQSVLEGRLTPGDLLVFMAYLRGIYSPVRQLAKTAGALGRGQASAERVIETLSSANEVPQPRSDLVKRFTGIRSSIRFEDIWFSYSNRNSHEFALRGLTFEIKAGTRHALVGLTGSGKTTILKLLPRFIDPQRGSIELDGIDIRELSLHELRRNIALVSQEPILLGETVWENIAYGLQSRSKQQAIRIAKNSGIHELIVGLREGYDTKIGERGNALSGGQRQCISVARAMGRNAPLVLLDEPTTGLDASTETVLLEALDRLSEGRTTVFVTHQLDTIRYSDRITVLSNGLIAEEGTHSELMTFKSHYWELQQCAALAGR